MSDALSSVLAGLVAGWLLLGPMILMALSRRVRGATKVFWVAGAVAPMLLAVLGVFLAIQLYPESPLHIHSNHLPAALFFSVAGAWATYVAFRRRYISGEIPNQP